MNCPVCGRTVYDTGLGSWAALATHILRSHPGVPERIRVALAETITDAAAEAARKEAS